MMRVVLDVNVLVSAFLNPAGTPGRILKLAFEGQLELAASAHLWAELERALAYPRVQERLQALAAFEATEAIKTRLYRLITLVPDRSPVNAWVAGDRDDDWIIQCALDAGATRLVSGDARVQALGQVEALRIVAPAAFLEEVIGGRGMG